jgi:hypothetical protein
MLGIAGTVGVASRAGSIVVAATGAAIVRVTIAGGGRMDLATGRTEVICAFMSASVRFSAATPWRIAAQHTTSAATAPIDNARLPAPEAVGHETTGGDDARGRC